MKKSKTNKYSIKDWAGSLLKLRDMASLMIFLNGMFTKQELKRIAIRWKLLELLVKNVPQREIAKKLNVSLCNITRGSRELRKSSDFKNMVIKLLKERN